MTGTDHTSQGFSILEFLIALTLLGGIVTLIVEFIPRFSNQLEYSVTIESQVQQQLRTHVALQRFVFHTQSLKKETLFVGSKNKIELKSSKSSSGNKNSEYFYVYLEGDENEFLDIYTVLRGKKELLFENIAWAEFQFRKTGPESVSWVDTWNETFQPGSLRLDFRPLSTQAPKQTMIWRLDSL